MRIPEEQEACSKTGRQLGSILIPESRMSEESTACSPAGSPHPATPAIPPGAQTEALAEVEPRRHKESEGTSSEKQNSAFQDGACSSDGELLLEEIVAEMDLPHQDLLAVIRFICQTPGKRLRSRLLWRCAEMVGGPRPQPVKAAALVELLHHGTLLHDDVIDRASVRRSRPTVNRAWGDAVAILAGDFLLTAVMDLALKTGHPDVPPAAVYCLAELVAGQMEELKNQGNLSLSESQYLGILRRKTGCLFAFSCRLGATLAQGNHDQARTAEDFGYSFGTAFQLVDDLLDYLGSREQTGKEPGLDFCEGKVTLPVLVAFKRGSPEEKARIRRIFESGQKKSRLSEFTAILHGLGGFSYTLAKARAYVSQAIGLLAAFPSSSARFDLEQTACTVVEKVTFDESPAISIDGSHTVSTCATGRG